MSSSYRKSTAVRPPGPVVTGCLGLFFGVFLLVGLAGFYLATVRPILQAVVALTWEETPCFVDSSRVVTISPTGRTRDDNVPTYKIEIVYHYDFHGTRYSSNRYQFSSGSSSGQARKQRVVDQYPADTKTVCYVNPSHPTEAVLTRALGLETFLGCFALIFAAVGGGGIYFMVRPRQWVASSQKNAVPTPAPVTGEPMELKPQFTPAGKFIALLLFALFWNGLMGVFGYLTFFSPTHSGVPLLAKIFVGFFCLIGVLILLAAIGSFLAMFNPRILLRAPTNAAALGGVFQFEWRVQGRADKLSKLRIVLEGREEATYFQGKTSHTSTSVFAEVPVFETLDHEVSGQGQARVSIPPGLMHTFRGRHNRIVWRLLVRGEIPKWAPIEQEHVILVLPHKVTT